MRLAYKSNGSVLWMAPLALAVGIPGALLLAAAIVIANVCHVTADTRPGTVCMVMGCAGATAVLVAAVCWIESALYLRHADLPFPEQAIGRHISPLDARDRVAIRRHNGVVFYIMAGTVALIPVAMIVSYLHDPLNYYEVSWRGAAIGGVLVTGGGLVWLMMGGLVARFVVSPADLRIETMLSSERIPRSLIGTFEAAGTEVRLRLTSGRSVMFRVDPPIVDWVQRGGTYRHNRRTQVRTIERILNGVAVVPAAAATCDTVQTRVRPIAVAVMMLLAIAMVTGAVLLVINWNTMPNGQ